MIKSELELAIHDEDLRYALACRSAATGKGKHCLTCYWGSRLLGSLKGNSAVLCTIGALKQCNPGGLKFRYWRPFFIQSNDPPEVSS